MNDTKREREAWTRGPAAHELAPAVVDTGPVAAYLDRLAPSGRRTQAGCLERAARLLTDGARGAYAVRWHAVTHTDLMRLRTRLAARYGPSTVTVTLAAVRGVLKAAFRIGLVDGDTIARLADVPGLPAPELPIGRALGADELVALVGAAGSQADRALACRDAALVSVLIATGARLGEATRLDARDVAGDVVTIRHGKGGRARAVPLPPRTAARVAAWVAQRGPDPGGGASPTRLWTTIPAPPTPLTLRSCYQRVVTAAARAELADVMPHDLRRTYATTLLSAGADPLLVATLLGHADVRTTMRYDRRALEVARPFLEALDV